MTQKHFLQCVKIQAKALRWLWSSWQLGLKYSNMRLLSLHISIPSHHLVSGPLGRVWTSPSWQRTLWRSWRGFLVLVHPRGIQSMLLQWCDLRQLCYAHHGVVCYKNSADGAAQSPWYHQSWPRMSMLSIWKLAYIWKSWRNFFRLQQSQPCSKTLQQGALSIWWAAPLPVPALTPWARAPHMSSARARSARSDFSLCLQSCQASRRESSHITVMFILKCMLFTDPQYLTFT